MTAHASRTAAELRREASEYAPHLRELSMSEVARILGVSPATVRARFEAGEFPSMRPPTRPGGWYRITRGGLERDLGLRPDATAVQA